MPPHTHLILRRMEQMGSTRQKGHMRRHLHGQVGWGVLTCSWAAAQAPAVKTSGSCDSTSATAAAAAAATAGARLGCPQQPTPAALVAPKLGHAPAALRLVALAACRAGRRAVTGAVGLLL